MAFYNTFTEKLGIQFTGTENKALIMAVDSWLGTPYRMGGCSKSGIDCSCLVQTIYADVYGMDLKRSSRAIFRDVRIIPMEELREGDLLFMITMGSRVSHVGIYLKDDKFVHASTTAGVIISSLQEDYYRNCFHAAGRIEEPRSLGVETAASGHDS